MFLPLYPTLLVSQPLPSVLPIPSGTRSEDIQPPRVCSRFLEAAGNYCTLTRGSQHTQVRETQATLTGHLFSRKLVGQELL